MFKETQPIMNDTIDNKCEYLKIGACKGSCFFRSRDYGMKPKYLGDGIIDYSECEIIKKINKEKNYAF